MSLRPIVSKGYSQTRGSDIWRTEVQGGLPRQGRDTYFEPVPISVTLVVSSLGRQAFYSFLNNIDGGASSFIMPHDTGMGIEDHQVLITSTISDSTDDGKNWVISFTATAERTAIQEDTCLTKNLPDLYGCYGDHLGSFMKIYANYETTFPRVWEPNVIASFDFNSRRFSGISFSRASTGAYFDGTLIRTAAVDIPRYETAGLLIEPESSNLATQSATFQTWAAAGATKSSTGPILIEGIPSTIVTATGTSFPRLVLVSTSGTPIQDGDYVLSFICQQNSQRFTLGTLDRAVAAEPAGTLRFYSDINTDTTSKTLTGTSVIFRSITSVPVGGGWHRHAVRVTLTGITGVNFFVGPSASLGSNSAAIGDSINVAHAQLEKATFETSPIITGTSSVSRAADILTLTAPGAPKRVYREYTPLGSTTAIIETVPYTGELCPPGHVRVIKVLND